MPYSQRSVASRARGQKERGMGMGGQRHGAGDVTEDDGIPIQSEGENGGEGLCYGYGRR